MNAATNERTKQKLFDDTRGHLRRDYSGRSHTKFDGRYPLQVIVIKIVYAVKQNATLYRLRRYNIVSSVVNGSSEKNVASNKRRIRNDRVSYPEKKTSEWVKPSTVIPFLGMIGMSAGFIWGQVLPRYSMIPSKYPNITVRTASFKPVFSTAGSPTESTHIGGDTSTKRDRASFDRVYGKVVQPNWNVRQDDAALAIEHALKDYLARRDRAHEMVAVAQRSPVVGTTSKEVSSDAVHEEQASINGLDASAQELKLPSRREHAYLTVKASGPTDRSHLSRMRKIDRQLNVSAASMHAKLNGGESGLLNVQKMYTTYFSVLKGSGVVLLDGKQYQVDQKDFVAKVNDGDFAIYDVGKSEWAIQAIEDIELEVTKVEAGDATSNKVGLPLDITPLQFRSKLATP